jgi:SAM-dependent methyltransferase
MPDRPCGICSNAVGNRTIKVREMMFGTRDTFEYLECAQCGCIQIAETPSGLQQHYPANYQGNVSAFPAKSILTRLMRHQRAKYCLGRGGFLGKYIVSRYGRPVSSIFGNVDPYIWLKRCDVTFSSRILDVGCGPADLLNELRTDGFLDLTGVDLFLRETGSVRKGLRLVKGEIFDLNEQFDLVMLHHSFEHMPAPQKVVEHIHRLLRPGRYAVIRIPVVPSFAYSKYGTNWAQLDAPRHLYLHSVESIRILAQQAGFDVAEVTFDSNEFQFWASEQYVNDIPLKDERSYWINPEKSMFSKHDIESFRTAAAELNKQRKGDSACFYLYKK